jgi:serine/threonine-protein kinase
MGVVYRAEHRGNHMQVAIKILLDARFSPARRERFEAEQRILARLKHPSIAQLFHADVLADGTPWFAMEFIDGKPIDQYCREGGCTMDQRLRLFQALCEAVQSAHAQTIVHRDLKPSNILVTADGAVKLLDFGIGKSLENPAEDARQTAPGMRLMTIAYAAPEQLRGERAVFSADVYALGVILYELAAGGLPFDLSKCTTGEAERVIAEQDAAKPSEAAGRNGMAQGTGHAEWKDLDALVLKAMHKDQARRYPSVEALLRDVGHYLKSEPLEARPDSLAYKAGKFVRRNRRALAAAMASLVVLLAVVLVFTERLKRARDAQLAEAARTERVEHFMLNIMHGGDDEVGPSGDLRVTDLLERGAKEAGALGHDRDVQADLYQTIATVYDSFGKFDRAESLLSSALEIRRSLYGRDSRQTADALVHLGVLRYHEGRLPEAEDLVRNALAMERRHLPPNHPATAQAMAALGKVLEERGKYQDAIAELQAAAPLQSGTDLAATLTLLANAYFYRGDYAESESLNRRVLAMDQQLHGDRHPDVADALTNLGNIRTNRGQFSEAERYFRQAWDIDRAWYGADHVNSADIETYVAQALTQQGRLGESRELLKHALAVFLRAYGGKPNDSVAMTYGELGKIARKLKDFDEAETDFKKAADTYAAMTGGNHQWVAVELSNLADVYRDRGRYAQAEQTLRDALGRLTAVLPAGHLEIGVASVKLGDVLTGEKRYREAEEQLLAGCAILEKQSPESTTLRAAREDLVAIYDALKMPDKAAQVRDKLRASGQR